MKRQGIILFIVIMIMVLAAGYIILLDRQKQQYVFPLKITGDITESILLQSRDKLEPVSVEYKGEVYKSFRVEDLIKMADPISGEYGLVMVGYDGLSALLDGDKLEECYLNYSSSNGWEAINLNHPVSSNIKHLCEIIVYTTGSLPEKALRIIDPEKNITGVTAGQLLKDGVNIYPYFEGVSTREVGGRDYQAGIYSRKRVVFLDELIGEAKSKRTQIIGARGESTVFNKGYLEVVNNQIDYFVPETDSRIEDVRGVILDALIISNRDAYHDALYYLEQERRVLLVLLDGFGFHQYQQATKKGYAPYLAGIEPAHKAITVFKPVTNAGLAAILTGVGPEKNGVYSRKQKALESGDIFQSVELLGKTAVNIEGNINIINTSLEPVLNPDKNGDGMTDDEVFATAIEAVKKDYSLVFVHFHGIDDTGHNYGDLSEHTFKKIKQIDNYLDKLAAEWPGKIIITADHGMHKTGNGGDHGLVCYQDLFVPYIITDGGEY